MIPHSGPPSDQARAWSTEHPPLPLKASAMAAMARAKGVAAALDEEALVPVDDGDGGNHHPDHRGKCQRGEQAEGEGESSEELGASQQPGVGPAGSEAERPEEAGRAVDAVASKPAEELLQAVSGQDPADGDADLISQLLEYQRSDIPLGKLSERERESSPACLKADRTVRRGGALPQPADGGDPREKHLRETRPHRDGR